MYKIIKEDKVIDVVQYADFIRFLPAGQVIRTNEELAEGLIGSDYQTLYSFKPVKNPEAIIVTIEEISAKEFNRLQNLLNSAKSISANEKALAQAKEAKIESLSTICKNMITEGFSITLADGKDYNFRLTTEDQLNLLNFENQLNSGAKQFIYHATALPCRVFKRDDMAKIIKAYRQCLLYHTTYFNVAKQYIASLTDLDLVNSFSYGADITSTATDPILRQILVEGGQK